MSRHMRSNLTEGGEVRIFHHTDGGVTMGIETPLKQGILHIAFSVILSQTDKENLFSMLSYSGNHDIGDE